MEEGNSHGNRIEQRLQEWDWEGINEIDLIGLVLSPGQSEVRALEAAHHMVGRLRSIHQLTGLSYPELRQVGFGHRRALAFLAAREILRRGRRRPLPPDRSFRSSADVHSYFRSAVEELQKECFWAILLDGKNRIVRIVRVSEGCLTRSIVHPREVFRPAIREAAAGILFVHNHPSGSPEPSQEDIQITQRLVETGKVVGIRILDHVIIGGYRYFSFADEGMI
jgi:DNA repair protein RadC